MNYFIYITDLQFLRQHNINGDYYSEEYDGHKYLKIFDFKIRENNSNYDTNLSQF